MAKRIGIGLLIVLVLGGIGAYVFRGPLLFLAVRMSAPSDAFDTATKAPAPDYASADAWLARPEKQDLADYVPAIDGAPTIDVAASSAGRGAKPVDVFFVHPTTYLHGEDWNDPGKSGTSTEENTRWVLANQASAYNGCCNVYAPRYRQTSIYGFFASDRSISEQALDFAYQDVRRAFEDFLTEIGDARPFILAGHSQGTIHLRRLLREKISGTPLVQRMVAAYLIGGGVELQELAAMPDVPACKSATDLGCVVHWATYGPEGRAPEGETGEILCTNPLTWSIDEEPAPANLNLGAVVPSGEFNVAFFGSDRARGVEFEPLGAPIVAHTGAQCRDGRLVVDAQEESPFADYARLGGQNYHGLDYALFYMNVRENTQRRVAAYLSRTAPGAPPSE
jgi:hypothetical protein